MRWSSTPGTGAPPTRAHIDAAFVRRLLPMTARSVWRHKALVLGIWLSVVALTIGLLAVLPRTYEVQAIIQAQSAELIPALGSGPRPVESESPTRQAADTILRHENLVALVTETEMVKKWPLHRAPLLRLKDAIRALFLKPRTEEQQVEGFVGLLQNKLTVTTTREGSVIVAIRFPDAELAFRLVEAAVQNFLEARHASEISSIGEAISLLETRTAEARENLDASLRQLQELRKARAARLGTRAGQAAEQQLTRQPDRETSQLLVQVQTKRRAVGDVEDFRRRRVAELETRLQESRSLYSSTHPVVLELEQSLTTLRRESSQIAALRQELAPLELQLRRRGFSPDTPPDTNRAREMALRAAALEPDDPHEDLDPDIAYAKSQGRHALSRYNGMLDRVASARLEQDTAQAAFKYRYMVTWPAEKPRLPIKPNPGPIVLACILAGLLVAVMSALLVDLYSHRLVEPWQVEQDIGVPLLAEIRIL